MDNSIQLLDVSVFFGGSRFGYYQIHGIGQNPVGLFMEVYGISCFWGTSYVQATTYHGHSACGMNAQHPSPPQSSHINLRFGRVPERHVEQHDPGREALVPLQAVLLPALLGREADHLHQGVLPRPQEEDVPVQRRGETGGEIGE